MASKPRKLTEKEFWAILRENRGLFSQTARAIEDKYGFPFTRQSVRERALRKEAALRDIEESNLDMAETVVFDLLESGDERVKADIAKFYLKTKGKQRGYIETQNIEIKNVSELTDEELSAIANSKG